MNKGGEQRIAMISLYDRLEVVPIEITSKVFLLLITIFLLRNI